MSAPGTPSRRQSQVADTLDDEEEDDALLPDSEKTKDDGQNAEGDADDDIFFEDDEMAKQAAFSTQVTDDMKYARATREYLQCTILNSPSTDLCMTASMRSNLNA